MARLRGGHQESKLLKEKSLNIRKTDQALSKPIGHFSNQ